MLEVEQDHSIRWNVNIRNESFSCDKLRIDEVEVPQCISWLPGVDRILPRKDCCAAADAQPHASYEASAGFDRYGTSHATSRKPLSTFASANIT